MPRIPGSPDEGGDPYADAASEPAAPEAAAPAEESAMESPRGLLPKSILMGKDFKPGDKIILRVDAIHDDEVEVSYPEEKEAEAGGAEEAPMEKPAGDAGMASMME